MSPRWLVAVGQATGGVAHDFNNALTAIITRASVLKVTSEDANVVEHAEAILEAANAANSVIERIRVIFNPTDSKAFVRLEPEALVRQAVELASSRAAKAQVELKVEGGGCPPVAGMPGELLQVVTNLTTNAIDASPANSVVTIRCREAGATVAFEVEDSGPGIPPELLARMFEPFVSTKGGGGTGLGLVLCRRIMEAHSGTVDLEPMPAGGTRATARVPIAGGKVAAPRLSTGLDLEAHAAPASVLIVDDDVSSLDALSILLEAAGFEVHTAETLTEGLQQFERVAPTLLVTDLGLGDEDGWTLVRRVRARDALVPIVVVSGDATITTSADEARRGVEAVMRKPINPGTLVNRLRELAEAQRNLRERLERIDG